MHEHDMGAGRDPGRAAGIAVAGRNAGGVGAVAAGAGVRRGRMISERGIRIGRAQGAVDFGRTVDAAVAVAVREARIEGAALVPQRQQPGAPVGMAEIGMREIEAPIDMRDHHAFAGGQAGRAADIGGARVRRGLRLGQGGFVGRVLVQRHRPVQPRRLDAGNARVVADIGDVAAAQPAGGDRAEAGDDAHAVGQRAAPVT